MDMRLEKSFAVHGTHRATIRANIFNFLNNANVLTMQTRAGSTFGYATAINQPRIMELNLAYSF
jgi:hypothetical protein